MAILGVDDQHVRRLSIPDGEVADAVSVVADAIESLNSPLVMAPWVHDHHPDHEACGEAARRVTDSVTYGLFWAWRHSPDHLADGYELVGLELEDGIAAARIAALTQHHSQLDGEPPVVGGADLAPLTWPTEYYLRAGHR